MYPFCKCLKTREDYASMAKWIFIQLKELIPHACEPIGPTTGTITAQYIYIYIYTIVQRFIPRDFDYLLLLFHV